VYALTVVNLLQSYLSILWKSLLGLSAQHERLWNLLSGHCCILWVHSAVATGSSRDRARSDSIGKAASDQRWVMGGGRIVNTVDMRPWNPARKGAIPGAETARIDRQMQQTGLQPDSDVAGSCSQALPLNQMPMYVFFWLNVEASP
jgi:hypothetical protein